MKKSRGFTLVELLIVTVVIAILMAIVFRLAGMGGESAARAKTISRLQKLSNAVSGYYAAFGSYPPVPLQGRSRDIHTRVNGNTMGYGIQGPASERSEGSWDKKQIEAACRAQPVGAGYPLDPETTEDADLATMAEVYHIKRYHVIDGNVGSFREGTEWSENNVFMFGLMSFLLPRYQFMLDGKQELYGFKAWLENNRVPYLLDGSRPDGWEKVQQDLRNADLRTTALVRQLSSLATSATIGAAPVPVPPPMPAVTNTRSEPLSTWEISSRLSSAARRPISGMAPAPSPLVSLSPIWILVCAFDRDRA